MINDVIFYFLFIVQAIFIARFHFEQSHVDAYLKPIRILRKITEPLIYPLRQVLPRGILRSFAPIIVAFIITLLMIFSIGLSNSSISFNVLSLFKLSIISLLGNWATLITYTLICYVILSWIPHPSLRIYYYLLHEFLSPLLVPIRRFLPTFGGMDLSPIVLYFLVNAVLSLVIKILI